MPENQDGVFRAMLTGTASDGKLFRFAKYDVKICIFSSKKKRVRQIAWTPLDGAYLPAAASLRRLPARNTMTVRAGT